MSERAYFYGDLKISKEDLDTVITVFNQKLEEDTSYFEDTVTKMDSGIRIDGRNYGSIPSSVIVAVEKALDEISQKYLVSPAELEYFYYGDGYYKVSYLPKQVGKRKFIGKYDPYSESIEFEQLTAEVFTSLGISEENITSIVSSYREFVRKHLLEGKRVGLPDVSLKGVSIGKRPSRKQSFPGVDKTFEIPESYFLELSSETSKVSISEDILESVKKKFKEKESD